MKRINLICTFLALGAISTSQLALAQQNPEQSMLPCDEVEQAVLAQATPKEVKRITAFTPAQIIERKNPQYPVQAARAAREGWVTVSYVIDAEGKVQDPIIEDYAGDRSFKRAAMSAIEDWQFLPAMKNGEPTQQCHQAVRIDFTMDGVNTGATRKFIVNYKEAEEYLKNDEIEKAEQAVEKLKSGKYRNRYENAWIWNLDASIANKLQDMPRELASIKRTIASAASHKKANRTFDDKYLGYLHQRKFVLEVNQVYFADALNTAKEIEALDNGEELIAAIEGTVGQVKEYIDSKANLFVEGVLTEDSSFFHLLVRNKFAFTEIQGNLETVEVRCESHREKFTVAEGFIWSIPESWGQCRVLVSGDSGTRFALVEVNQV